MKRFEPGERVACYSETGRETGTVNAHPRTFVDVMIETSSGPRLETYHPKQLRRLKKRERRRWQMRGNEPLSLTSSIAGRWNPFTIVGPELAPGETVEVIEVRKRK